MDATRRVMMRRLNRPSAVLAAIAIVAASGGASVARPGPATALSLLAIPDTLSITHDQTRTVPAPGVLANDVKLLGTIAVLDSQPSNGSVSLSSNGGYTYDPDPGYVGTDVFRYHDFGGLLATNTTTVTITVRNAAPVAADDEESANAGRKETEDAPGVLENDHDVDGDALQAKLVAGPDHGTLTLRADGGFDYTGDSGFDGNDTWTYVATDGIANSAPATVTMNVSASGSTPRPSVPPTPTPTPPTPAPTLPLPTLTLPPLPLPTPSPSARPSASPSGGPAASPTPAPTRPAGGSPVTPSPGPSDPPGSAGAGGAGGRGEGGGAGTANPGGGAPGSGGGPGEHSASGSGSDADGPVFSVAGNAPEPVVPLINAAFAAFDGFDWAVPALTLSVPGLLLMLAVLAQLTAGAIWLPVARRWLGAFGPDRRRRRRGRPA